MVRDNYVLGWTTAIEKIGGVGTEVAGTLLNPFSLGLTVPALALGAMVGEKDENMAKINKGTLSNLVLPGVAPFRLGKRLNRKLAKD